MSVFFPQDPSQPPGTDKQQQHLAREDTVHSNVANGETNVKNCGRSGHVTRTLVYSMKVKTRRQSATLSSFSWEPAGQETNFKPLDHRSAVSVAVGGSPAHASKRENSQR